MGGCEILRRVRKNTLLDRLPPRSPERREALAPIQSLHAVRLRSGGGQERRLTEERATHPRSGKNNYLLGHPELEQHEPASRHQRHGVRSRDRLGQRRAGHGGEPARGVQVRATAHGKHTARLTKDATGSGFRAVARRRERAPAAARRRAGEALQNQAVLLSQLTTPLLARASAQSITARSIKVTAQQQAASSCVLPRAAVRA